MEGLTKEHKHDRKARLAALGPAFSLYRGDDRLWSLQKLSVQGYSAGLMDTGHDAILQPGLCSLKDSSSYQDIPVCLWWSFKCLCRTMWLSRELFLSGVKQSWRARKLSKNSFSPQPLAEQALCVYLLASDQSCHICDKGKGCTIGLSRVLWYFATLLEQSGVLFFLFICFWFCFLFFSAEMLLEGK